MREREREMQNIHVYRAYIYLTHQFINIENKRNTIMLKIKEIVHIIISLIFVVIFPLSTL